MEKIGENKFFCLVVWSNFDPMSSLFEIRWFSDECFFFQFQAANVQQVLTEVKASNQMAQFLGNKVEMAITKAVEGNKTLQRVGLHFEFGDCR